MRPLDFPPFHRKLPFLLAIVDHYAAPRAVCQPDHAVLAEMVRTLAENARSHLLGYFAKFAIPGEGL